MGRSTFAIATLRLRAGAPDTVALRLRAARELQAADLSPAGLPPAAVLVVRRLADPMPGQFGGGNTRPQPEWEAAVRGALRSSADAAARPDRGRIDPSANAVLFADDAEIVACLLADMIRGEVDAHWWWRRVLPRLDLSAAIARAGARGPAAVLRERPRETPAALTLLASWGEAAHLAARISPSDAMVVLAALAQTHRLENAVVAPSVAVAPAPLDRSPAPAEAIAPWQEALPAEIAEPMAPAVRALFGIALALHASPWRLRSAAAVRMARAWWTSVLTRSCDAPPHPPHGEPTRDQSPTSTPESSLFNASSGEPRVVDPIGALSSRDQPPSVDAAAAVGASSEPTAAVDQTVSAPAGESQRSDERRPQLAAPSSPALSRVPAVSAPPDVMVSVRLKPRPEAESAARLTHLRRQEPGSVVEADGRRRDAPASAATEVPPLAEWPGACVVTRLGGLLYLVHALENLGIPDAFEERWALASQAGPWGALDLIGRALLGHRFASMADDPIWPVLARLAAWTPAPRRGRDPAFHVPERWRSLLDDHGERLNWTFRDRRLWIWSREGYLVAHRAWHGARAPNAAAVRRELRRPGVSSQARIVQRRDARIPLLTLPAVPAGCPARYGRLAAAIAPAVRRRLLLAIGGERRSRRDRIAELLQVRARLYVSSSHVDLVATLDRADLAIRRAGLDRDPGWLPGYGRVIYFHFS